MKIILAALFFVCIACGTTSAEPGTTATPPIEPSSTLSPVNAIFATRRAQPVTPQPPTPQPTATQAVTPDYGSCITVLAFLAINHEHPLDEQRAGLFAGATHAAKPEMPHQYAGFATSPTFDTPETVIVRFCTGLLDNEVLNILSSLNRS